MKRINGCTNINKLYKKVNGFKLEIPKKDIKPYAVFKKKKKIDNEIKKIN